ncbi:MAG: esterase-like activity of phytase family protein [Bauldia sp.]
MIQQVAYPVDAIPAAPGPGKPADNGVSDFLSDNDANHLIVIERSGVQAADGQYKDYIRLYAADTSVATDVQSIPSLVGATYTSVAKHLLLDLDKASIGYVDNIEGISWGPKLSDGNDTLILVSDNNFNSSQQTQFLAFEIYR